MTTDKRKKGCPNEDCERHQKKIMLKATEEFCPKCGAKLIFVCAKCFREIDDIDEKHKICSLCEAEAQEKKDAAADKAKKAGKAVAGVITPIIVGVAGKVIKDGQKGAINKGVKAVEQVAQEIIKK